MMPLFVKVLTSVQALYQLYHSTDAEAQQAANLYLLSFQSSKEAWGCIVALLQSQQVRWFSLLNREPVAY